MRARNIKPGFFKNELLGVENPLISILFIGLWCLADKAGRLEDRPLRIKAEVFPYRDGLNINGYLTVLKRLGFIHRYVIDEIPYIQVINFEKHQYCHHTEKCSEIPEYSNGCSLTVKDTLSNGDNPPDILNTDILNTDILNPSPENGDGKKNNPPSKKQSINLPEFINPQTWADFCEMRKKIKKPLTDRAANMIVKRLSGFHSSGENVETILENSIVNCWYSVFPSKNNNGFSHKSPDNFSEFD